MQIRERFEVFKHKAVATSESEIKVYTNLWYAAFMF